MKLTRKKRIVLELFGPPALGAILLFLYALVTAAWNQNAYETDENFQPNRILATGAIYLGYAYFFAGIPSIIYTAIMEWRFTRTLEPDSWQAVQLSAFLGTGAGFVLGLAVGEFRFQSVFWMMSSIGLTVGFLLGLLIKHWSTERKSTGENPL